MHALIRRHASFVFWRSQLRLSETVSHPTFEGRHHQPLHVAYAYVAKGIARLAVVRLHDVESREEAAAAVVVNKPSRHVLLSSSDRPEFEGEAVEAPTIEGATPGNERPPAGG